MVTRDYYLRHWQPVQERADCLELPSAGALREIARHCDQIGPKDLDSPHQRIQQRRVGPAEVHSAEMHNGMHELDSLARYGVEGGPGTPTDSAAGSIR